MAAYDYEDAGYDPRGPSAAGAAQPAYDPNFVPDSVKTFVAHLYRHIREKNVYEIHQMYEGSFQRLSERMFRDSPWPSVEAVAPYVDNDHVFCLLYREMWFRHVYARLSPTPRQRVESWDNYCSLFGVVLHGVVNMQLPNQWLWDMVDEFVYQFQSYCQYRAKLKTKTEEELQILREDDRVWNVYGVLNYLQALVEKSTIIQILEREKEDLEQFTATDGYDYEGGSNVLKMLGYYSMIGLLRVHCLLGDYHTGLKCLAPIDISQQGVYTTVIGSHIATIYHYGFASLMLRRYVEAVREFNRILVYIIKYKSLFQKSAQYDQILKKNEQMYALLALSLSLCPQTRLVEEASSSQLKDKYGEKMAKMQRFDDEAYTLFDELFSYACPKFITPSAPDLKEPLANYNQDAYRLQLKLFLYEVKQQQLLSGVRSYLKLYSTISTAKLATYLEVDEPTLRTILMTYKHKMHSVDSDGKIISNADVDFYITEDIVHRGRQETNKGDSSGLIVCRRQVSTLSLSIAVGEYLKYGLIPLCPEGVGVRFSCNSTSTISKRNNGHRAWWYEDLVVLKIETIKKAIENMIARKLNHVTISRFLFYFLKCEFSKAKSTEKRRATELVIELLYSLDENCVSCINEFLFSVDVDNINLVKLNRYVKESNIIHKVSGYGTKTVGLQNDSLQVESHSHGAEASVVSCFQALVDILFSLTNNDADGRVIVSRQHTCSGQVEDGYIKFVMLSVEKIFSEIIGQARAIVLAGGTLQPIEEMRVRLFPGVLSDQVHFFTCSHIVPPESILPIAVPCGPSGLSFDFSFNARSSPNMIEELGRLLCNLVAVIPEGIVVFFSSFDYEGQVYDTWKASGTLQRIIKKKNTYLGNLGTTWMSSMFLNNTRKPYALARFRKMTHDLMVRCF